MFPRCGSESKCSQHSGCKQHNLNKYQRAAMKCQLLSWTKAVLGRKKPQLLQMENC